MTIAELRCPRCNAPLDVAHAGLSKCKYCGAALMKSLENAGPLAPSDDDAENPGFLTIHLDDVGANKNAVLQVIHDQMHLGLKDSLDLVNTAPCRLATAMEGGSAKTLLAALAKAGAKVRAT